MAAFLTTGEYPREMQNDALAEGELSSERDSDFSLVHIDCYMFRLLFL